MPKTSKLVWMARDKDGWVLLCDREMTTDYFGVLESPTLPAETEIDARAFRRNVAGGFAGIRKGEQRRVRITIETVGQEKRPGLDPFTTRGS